jgi:CheY-like chemotaxis protein
MKKIVVAGSIVSLIEGRPGVLSRKEFSILPAASAEGVLAAHEAVNADLIIVDSDMPEMGGEALCFLLRKKELLKKVSVIVISDGGDQVSERLMACGANAVIARPVDPSDLEIKIRGLLDISERKNLREVVKISVGVTSEDESFFAVSRNISISGLLVETNRVLSPGLIITCSFVLQHRLIVEGEIVRVAVQPKKKGGKCEYGVRFMRTDPATEAEIAEYIRRRDLIRR